MWQDRQAKLLKREIEDILFLLSDTPELFAITTESINQTGQGIIDECVNSHPWPLLLLVVCESVSGSFKQALPAAASFYLFKKAAEIFDDIEDSDSSESLSAKYGSAIATNVGTTLLILAEKTMSKLKTRGVEEKIIVDIIDEVNSSFITACSGQHLDLSNMLETGISEDKYIQISTMKSASVTECACRIGAILATENKKLIDMFSKYGHYLGIASQIANDILGITRESDIIKPKITLPIIYAMNFLDDKARCNLALWLNGQSEIALDSKDIKELLFQTGAIYYSTIKVEFYKQKAYEILSKLTNEKIYTHRLNLFLK